MIRSQPIAPISAAKIDGVVERAGFTTSFAIVSATFVPKKMNADEVEERRPGDRLLRREHAGRHDGRDRVRRVVEAVDEVEEQRDADDDDDDDSSSKLGHNRLDLVGDILASVDRRLDLVQQVLPHQDLERIGSHPSTGRRSPAGR